MSIQNNTLSIKNWKIINQTFFSSVFGHTQKFPDVRFDPSSKEVVIYNPNFPLQELFDAYMSFRLGKAAKSKCISNVDADVYTKCCEKSIYDIHAIGRRGPYYFKIAKSNDLEDTIDSFERRIGGQIGHIYHDQEVATISELILFDLFMRWYDSELWSVVSPETTIVSASIISIKLEGLQTTLDEDDDEEDLTFPIIMRFNTEFFTTIISAYSLDILNERVIYKCVKRFD